MVARTVDTVPYLLPCQTMVLTTLQEVQLVSLVAVIVLENALVVPRRVAYVRRRSGLALIASHTIMIAVQYNPHVITVSQPPLQLVSQVSLQQLNFHQQLPNSTLQLSTPPSQWVFGVSCTYHVAPSYG